MVIPRYRVRSNTSRIIRWAVPVTLVPMRARRATEFFGCEQTFPDVCSPKYKVLLSRGKIKQRLRYQGLRLTLSLLSALHQYAVTLGQGVCPVPTNAESSESAKLKTQLISQTRIRED